MRVRPFFASARLGYRRTPGPPYIWASARLCYRAPGPPRAQAAAHLGCLASALPRVWPRPASSHAAPHAAARRERANARTPSGTARLPEPDPRRRAGGSAVS